MLQEVYFYYGNVLCYDPDHSSYYYYDWDEEAYLYVDEETAALINNNEIPYWSNTDGSVSHCMYVICASAVLRAGR